MHNHLIPDESALYEYEKSAKELGIQKIVSQGLEWQRITSSINYAIQYAIARRPDLVVGFVGINLWEKVDPDRVDQLRDDDFSRLKFILPTEPYHSERFFPYYERAETLGMSILSF